VRGANRIRPASGNPGFSQTVRGFFLFQPIRFLNSLLQCNEYFASKNLKVDTMFALFVLRPVGRISREPCSGEGVVVHFHKNCMSDIPGHDERTLMSNTEKHDIAEGLFAPKQSHEEIRDAIKLEEARRAAMVKNLHRLRNLRLSKNNSSSE